MTAGKDDFMAQAVTTLRDGMKLKKIMKERGLRRARARCPECVGTLHGALAGRKDHLRFACDGPCQRRMME